MSSSKHAHTKVQNYLRTLESVIGLPKKTLVEELKKYTDEKKQAKNILRERKGWEDILTEPEALSLVLYNGPVSGPTTVHSIVNKMLKEQTKDGPLVALAFHFYSGLIKLGRKQEGKKDFKVYRGVASVLWKKNDVHIWYGATSVFEDQQLARKLMVSSNSKSLLEIKCRPEDPVGMHSPVSMKDLSIFPEEEKLIFPPLTAIWVKGVRREGDLQIVQCEATYLLQVFQSVTAPSDHVWSDVKDGKTKALIQWLQDHPLTNLEVTHQDYKCTLLYSAARFGNLEAVRLLLTNCAHINTQYSQAKSTALHAACFFGHKDVAKLLLDSKADPHLKNQHPEGSFTPYEETTSQDIKALFEPYAEKKRTKK